MGTRRAAAADRDPDHRLLLERRTDYDAALRDFAWPQLDEFNWALEHFDAIGADPGASQRPALWIVEEDGREAKYSFAEMSERSNRVANWLRAQGVARGDRIILMLANQVELWETILAAMKLGAVIIPSTPMLGSADLRDRVERGSARHVVVRDADVDKFDDVPGEQPIEAQMELEARAMARVCRTDDAWTGITEVAVRRRPIFRGH